MIQYIAFIFLFPVSAASRALAAAGSPSMLNGILRAACGSGKRGAQ